MGHFLSSWVEALMGSGHKQKARRAAGKWHAWRAITTQVKALLQNNLWIIHNKFVCFARCGLTPEKGGISDTSAAKKRPIVNHFREKDPTAGLTPENR